MRHATSLLILAVTAVCSAPALAASGAEFEGMGVLMIMFIGFGAMIIAFQAVLVAMLLFTMVKALVTKPAIEPPVLAAETTHDR